MSDINPWLPKMRHAEPRVVFYRQARREVLLALDPKRFMDFADTHLAPVVRARLRACWQRDGDVFLLMVMHKIRAVLPEIPVTERDVSILWLNERGIQLRTRQELEAAASEGWPSDSDIP